MFTLIGLGNPGLKYKNTRHNAGWWVVDEFVGKFSLGSQWTTLGSCHAMKILYSEKTCLILKPQRYMNRSGEAVAPVLKYLKLRPNSAIIIHDEIDLPTGVIRVKKGGSHGGHNGLKDLITHFGTKDFLRLRIGIGRPASKSANIIDWVLGAPGSEEQKLLKIAVLKAVDYLPALLDGDKPSLEENIR